MKAKQKNAINQRCKACKESIIVSKIFCRRLGEYVDDLVYCPYFTERPPVEIHAVQ